VAHTVDRDRWQSAAVPLPKTRERVRVGTRGRHERPMPCPGHDLVSGRTVEAAERSCGVSQRILRRTSSRCSDNPTRARRCGPRVGRTLVALLRGTHRCVQDAEAIRRGWTETPRMDDTLRENSPSSLRPPLNPSPRRPAAEDDWRRLRRCSALHLVQRRVSAAPVSRDVGALMRNVEWTPAGSCASSRGGLEH
jgi:hypothetical protein